MKTVRWIVVAAGGALLLAWMSGVVGFHYTRVVDDEPLQNPVEVIGVVENQLYLSDLRVIKLQTGSHEQLLEAITQSAYQVDIQGTEPYVTLYARTNRWVCGTPWAQPIRIPLIPETVYRNRREMIGYGEFVEQK
ncbi:hypothetical protein [Stieleria varia]|uniref:Uncharacterized protein n=1 Tax=Stieleria varia TaxID=2528005 RepID=A0A5C6AY29_9BACT|nr:hypothetical protein [Stieleria varia]TWU04650.1 hypothetical protein Pla52n_26920 [Stieleria varia]